MRQSSVEARRGACADEVAIRCRDLGKRFETLDGGGVFGVIMNSSVAARDAFQALQGITLDVPKGEFLGLLGRNGAGKSTLLRTLGGVFMPTTGDLELTGSASGVYALGIEAQTAMSGRRFAERWLQMSGEPTRDIPKLLADIESFAELGEYFDQPIRTYSTGMRARLFFGTVTAIRAQVYLVDEILAVGDEYFSAKCWRRVREKIAHGTSGIFATHDWAAMLRLCTAAIVLDAGRIVDQGAASDVARRYVDAPDEGTRAARFGSTLVSEFIVESDAPAAFTIPVELVDTDEAVFAFSVETIEGGGGWRHLLHVDPMRVGPGKGAWTVRVDIPRMPLPRGTYFMNVFLSSPDNTLTGSRVSYETRGWLTGNPIVLKVNGAATKGIAQLPVRWSLE